MRPKTAGVLLSVLTLVASLAAAQPRTTGQITGRITDEEDRPLVGATVIATSSETGLERRSVTDVNGEYLLPLLPVGHWTVGLTATSREPQLFSFRLGVGESVPLSAVLLPGEAVAEEMTVYGAATALDQTHTGVNLGYREQVEALPLANRSIRTISYLSGHLSDASPNQNPAIAGAPSYDTVTLLDGAEISDPYFGINDSVYLEDAIEEVQVLTSGVSARYGRFQGGVINAITKSGSNDYETSARYEFHKESWNDKTPFGESQSDTLNKTYQATAGGFILEDRLWFFAGYRKIPDTSDARTTSFTGEGFTSRYSEDRWQLKLRGAPASNHLIDVSHLELDALAAPWTWGISPGHLASANGVSDYPKGATAAAYQGVLTPSLFLELQATEKRSATGAGGDPDLGCPILDWSTFSVYNNYWWDRTDADIRDNETLSGNLTYWLSTEKAGSHTFEAGVQRVVSITGGDSRQSPSTYNLIGFNPDFVDPAPGPDGEPRFNLRTEQAPGWFDPYRERATLHRLRGDLEASLADLETLIELQPNWPALYHDRGRVYLEQGLFEEALEEFERYLAFPAESDELRWDQAEALLGLARQEEALQLLEEAIERRPKAHWLRDYLGEALLSLGRLDAAIAAHDGAVLTQPTQAPGYAARAAAKLLGNGSCGEVGADLRRALELGTVLAVGHPGDPAPFEKRAELRSQVAWTQAAYGHERCPEALRLTEAVELGRETVAFDPRNADFHRALGMALYRTGAHEEAREAFLRSLELRTQEDAFSLLGLAMAQEALANTARASELFERGRERARETFPQHPGLILLQNEAEGLLTG